ncbi:hypothetical protein GCM10028772_08020 [Nocardioides ultimimeridianus]
MGMEEEARRIAAERATVGNQDNPHGERWWHDVQQCAAEFHAAAKRNRIKPRNLTSGRGWSVMVATWPTDYSLICIDHRRGLTRGGPPYRTYGMEALGSTESVRRAITTALANLLEQQDRRR